MNAHMHIDGIIHHGQRGLRALESRCDILPEVERCFTVVFLVLGYESQIRWRLLCRKTACDIQFTES